MFKTLLAYKNTEYIVKRLTKKYFQYDLPFVIELQTQYRMGPKHFKIY